MGSRSQISCHHNLEERTYLNPYKCSGCKMKGLGQVYRCSDCDYVLHMECKFPSTKISPQFLPNDTFIFMEHPPPRPCSNPSCTQTHKRFCDACGKSVNGFGYHCQETKFDLHPCCAILETHFDIEEVEFRLNTKSKLKKCDWCQSKLVEGNDGKIPGWFYESENKDYSYHVSCVMDMAVRSCARTGGGGQYSLALENLEMPLKIVKRRNGKNGDKFWRILKIFITTILSIVFGDPTTILANLAVETVTQLLN